MTKKQFYSLLGGVDPIRKGHFVGTSGVHFAQYFDKDKIYPHAGLTSRLCRYIAKMFCNLGIEVVISPAVGGCVLSSRVAEHLSDFSSEEVLALYCDKDGSHFVIRRGYRELIKNRKVLVVEDTINTGLSVRKVVRVTRDVGGEVIGAGSICSNAKITTAHLNVTRFHSLLILENETWAEEICPLCRNKVPINTEVGHGANFLAR